MTNFYTLVGCGVYRIQFETDNKKAYMAVQTLARMLVDHENAEKVAVSEMENATHTDGYQRKIAKGGMEMKTPEQFLAMVQEISDENEDVEAFHDLTDTLMEDLLIDLGYGEGIELIRSKERWYA